MLSVQAKKSNEILNTKGTGTGIVPMGDSRVLEEPSAKRRTSILAAYRLTLMRLRTQSSNKKALQSQA